MVYARGYYCDCMNTGGIVFNYKYTADLTRERAILQIHREGICCKYRGAVSLKSGNFLLSYNNITPPFLKQCGW